MIHPLGRPVPRRLSYGTFHDTRVLDSSLFVLALALHLPHYHWFSFSLLTHCVFLCVFPMSGNHFPMPGKKRRKNDLTDSDSEPNSADELDSAMDSSSPVLGLRSPATSARDTLPTTPSGFDPRSAQTTADSSQATGSGSDPRATPTTADPSQTTAPGNGPRPNLTTTSPPVGPSEPFMESCGSYVIIKPKDEGVSFRKINVFWPTKYLGMICGSETLKIETPANGTLIVKTETRAQTKALLKCTKFCEKEVSVSLHHARNSSKGTVFAPELRHMSEDEILAGLRPEGVSHVRRLTTFRDGKRRDTSLLVLTFTSSKLPDTLLAGYIRYTVKVFIPNPLRCFRCQRYGHGSQRCTHDARCQACGNAPHGDSPCPSASKCLSCEDAKYEDTTSHSTNSPQCPIWKKEKAICNVQATTGVSFPQARRAVEEQMSKQPVRSYAQAAKQQTTSSSTQTDDIPQLPPLKLLSPSKPTTADSSTLTAPSPVPAPAVTPVPAPAVTPVTALAVTPPTGPRSDDDQGGSWTMARHSSSRSHTKAGQSGQADSPSARSQTDPRNEEPHDRQPRPAVRVSMGRSRSISSGRLTNSGGPAGGKTK